MINVYPCGTTITSVYGAIPGIITGILIWSNDVKYEISYFADGIHQVCTMYESEFVVTNDSTKSASIGFKNGK